MVTEQLILRSAQEYNILPITSCCDAACVFCSHRQNPPGIETVTVSPRSLEEIERTLEFLDGEKTIFIGESATKIIEGEPLSHPRFEQVLKITRKKFPSTTIFITTNGIYLGESIVSLLSIMGPVEINLSLNSATVEGRKKLMPGASRIIESLKGASLLKQYGIVFHGSIVAMPHLVGWQDVEETIVFLDEHGARSIRIFMPGFSRLAPEKLKFDHSLMHRDLRLFVRKVRNKVSCPVILEPPLLEDLLPVVAGVIKGTPVDLSGFKTGDIIKKVNGQKPESRVEAWYFLNKPGTVSAVVERDGQELTMSFDNARGEKNGIVMEYDFDMKRARDMERVLKKYSAGRVLILCSMLAYKIVSLLASMRNFEADICPVPSIFFGGSVGAAGLLTIEDFSPVLESYSLKRACPDAVFLPREAFDAQGRDLTGRGIWEVEEKFRVKAEVV